MKTLPNHKASPSYFFTFHNRKMHWLSLHGLQGKKASCSRNDASSDPGVKPWLTFKELQEFKPLPLIFPILAAKKKGMTTNVTFGFMDQMAMTLDTGKCNTFLDHARQSHKRIGVIRKDTTTDNQQIVGLSYPKCSCRNCVTTYKHGFKRSMIETIKKEKHYLSYVRRKQTRTLSKPSPLPPC
ncbi:unnamed protein product, partial [Brassica oleracea]